MTLVNMKEKFVTLLGRLMESTEENITVHYHAKNIVIRNIIEIDDINISGDGLYINSNWFILDIQEKIVDIIEEEIEGDMAICVCFEDKSKIYIEA